MKNKAKLFLGGLTLLLSAVVLSGCTKSFCSVDDQANMLYAYDYGVTAYFDGGDENLPEGATPLAGFNNVYTTVSYSNCEGLKAIIDTATSNGIKTPSLNYWATLDSFVLNNALNLSNFTDSSVVTAGNIVSALNDYGYLKYSDSVTTGYKKDAERTLWLNWDNFDQQIRKSGISIDECPTRDFISAYKSSMNNYIAAYRSCLAIKKDDYGYYGYGSNKTPVTIEAKTWKYAWQKGFLTGLLVWPIGALTDVIVDGLQSEKMPISSGIPQLLAILIVTVIVRSLMLVVTMKQTASNAKMQQLQPEIAKIQAKYPNANTNQYEKQRMAEETSRLYKKHKINPLSSLLVLIVQFPVFICVWGALQGCSSLSSGTFLGLRLSDSIGTLLFNGANWKTPGSGVWTALILFILMAGAQTVSMLLPQWMQKSKAKKIAKLGRNPAKKEQDNKMKWFTYIMLAMIIIMGFSLASAMGVYWLVGALFSIAQTLITNAVNEKKSHKKGK